MGSLIFTLIACSIGAAPGDDVTAKFEEQAFKFTGGEYQDEAFGYRLLKPEHVEPGKKYPLVLFLHGAGERGDDNVSQLQYLPELMATAEYRKRFPCFLIAPQCRKDKLWVTRGKDKLGVGEQMQVAEGILQQVEKDYPIDLNRVYLTGLSMGGFGSWNLATRHPDWFAAVVPICGGGDPSQAKALAGVPIWAFHGADDKVVQPGLSRSMIEAVREAGGQPKYTELKGVGHDSWTPAYEDRDGVLPWMFSQVNDRRRAIGATP